MKMTRQLSIDCYRGLTIAFMLIVNTPGTWSHVFPPLLHAPWHGFTPTDFVFPSFLFIVGVSMWFAFEKFDRRLSPEAVRKILKRTALLVGIGLLLAFFPFFNKNLATLRFPGVLQRIGLCYGLASLLCLWFRPRTLAFVSGAILLVYWAIMLTFASPGDDPFGLENNAARQLDRLIFSDLHIYKGEGIPFDPEGLLSTLPAVVTVILGWFSGMLMGKFQGDLPRSIRNLALAGAVCAAVGLVWHLGFPINKKLWTSSFVLFSGGLSMLLLAASVWAIDLRGWRRGVGFFLVFGANPLFAYVLSGVLVKSLLAVQTQVAGEAANGYKWLWHNVFRAIEPYKTGSLLFAVFFLLVVWAVCKWMYDRRIFVKI